MVRMNKNMLFIIGILTMLFIAACAPAKEPAPAAEPQPVLPESAETGEASIDDVGAAISNVDTAEDDLDDSGLEDLDAVLGDIEKI